MTPVPPTDESLRNAAEILRQGGVVAYPTETVYGLAVDPFSPTALQRLYAVKGRPDGRPVLLIIADPADVDRVARQVSPVARRCMDAFWPGPLSLVLDAVEGLPPEIAPEGKVCVRCPGLDSARALCAAFGGAVTSTSANLSGQPPATNAADAQLSGVDLVLDGGHLAPSAPSTVYDPDTDTIHREGAISATHLRAL